MQDSHSGRWGWRTALLLLVTAALASPLPAATRTSGVLGAGTTWETRWVVVDSELPGPTVLVSAGMHGNEPAAVWAARQIEHWPVAKGKLIVLPCVNRLGFAANIRWSPDYRNDREKRDLNRNFPRQAGESAKTKLCQAVWEFVASHQPDWVFDLHEGFDFHRLNSKSVGSSVIAMPKLAEFGKALQETVNQDVPAEIQFDLLAKSGPVQGGLARSSAELLGASAFILETTFKEQPISLRTRQHRRMMSTALQRIGLIEQDTVDLLAPADGRTCVAVFDDNGANEGKVMDALDDASLLLCHVGPKDMRPAVLKQFDVLVFPGGSGSKQGKAIGEVGRGHIREYAKRGGGIIGICAGAYLCSSHYTWSLNLMNARVFNKTVEIPGKGRKSMWYRGPAADVKVDVTDEGAGILGIEGRSDVRYHNGPILSPGDDPQLPAYRPLAFFRSENGIYEPQKNTMINAPAVVASQLERGRVLAISPHFESTKGREDVLLRAVEYVRRGPARSAQ